MRREFVRRIEKVAYALALEADRETNLIAEEHIDVQEMADITEACIEDLVGILTQGRRDNLIDGVQQERSKAAQVDGFWIQAQTKNTLLS